ncbi:MAG: MFS transporter [Anaerolineae bacterium]
MRAFNPIALDRNANPEARQVLALLVVAVAVLSFGFNAWAVLFNNFGVDELGLGAGAIGSIQSLREIPGLLGFVLGAIVLVIPEMRLIGICLLLMGGGLVFMGRSDGYGSLLAATMIISVGFHFFDSANQSLALTYASREHAPRVLSALNSLGSVAALIGTLAVFVFSGLLGMRMLTYLAGGITLIGGAVVAVLGHQSGARQPPRKVVFRRRYWLYYVLTFLLGSRRHVFGTFAILLLVKVYHLNVQQTALLSLVNGVLIMLTYPLMGRLVVRFGERLILAASFALLVPVFLGYGYITWLPLLVLLYAADNILSGLAFALNTYFQKIADSPEEITANVSMGQTINHLSAVFVPWLGGLLWQAYGYSATFLAGTGIVLLGLAFSLWVRTGHASGREGVAISSEQ